MSTNLISFKLLYVDYTQTIKSKIHIYYNNNKKQTQAVQITILSESINRFQVNCNIRK